MSEKHKELSRKDRDEIYDAIFKGQLDVLQRHLDNGWKAQINEVIDDGELSLGLAAVRGNLEVCKLLLDNGANVNALDKKKTTALCRSVCTFDGRDDVARFLLTAGADPNIPDNEGKSPLYLAARFGHLELLRLLVLCGADLNATTNSGATVLDGAATAHAKHTFAGNDQKSQRRAALRKEIVTWLTDVAPCIGAGFRRSPSGTPAPGTASEAKSKDERPWVMVSYCWNEQPAVLKLVKALRAAGCRVWFDKDHMNGDTMDAMARAVEGAAAFICCASPGYEVSQNCRLEGQYAQQQRKPIVPLMVSHTQWHPSGWLGLLYGAQLYYLWPGEVDPIVTRLKGLAPAAFGEPGEGEGEEQTQENQKQSAVEEAGGMGKWFENLNLQDGGQLATQFQDDASEALLKQWAKFTTADLQRLEQLQRASPDLTFAERIKFVQAVKDL